MWKSAVVHCSTLQSVKGVTNYTAPGVENVLHTLQSVVCTRSPCFSRYYLRNGLVAHNSQVHISGSSWGDDQLIIESEEVRPSRELGPHASWSRVL